MKGRFLLLAIILIFSLSGKAQENRINKLDSLIIEESPAFVLLSRDYSKRIDFIKNLKPAEIGLILKSDGSLNKLDSIVTTKWSEESFSFEKEFKYEYRFENEGREVHVKIFEWEFELVKWKKTYELVFMFNNQDNLIQSVFEMFLTSIYKTFTKIDYTYSDNLLTGETRYTKYEEEEAWIKDGQIEYQYNSNDWLETVFTDVWDDYFKIWITGDKVEYIYDESGNLTKESGSNWDEYSFEWTEKYRIENSFDEYNNRIESIEYVQGFTSEALELDTKFEFRYDSNGEKISEILYEWEYDQLIWLEKVKHEYFHPELEIIFRVESFDWIENNHSWQSSLKTEFSSANKLREEDILYWDYVNAYLPVYSFEGEVYDLVENFEWKNNAWRKTSTTNYYFSPEITVGIDPVVDLLVRIYPNPVVDFLKLEIGNFDEVTFILRDILGRTLLQRSVWQNENVNLASYKSGVYFVELRQNGDRIFSGKVLKR
jgi:hypothetical protein